mgnify:CR=1 FL=1
MYKKIIVPVDPAAVAIGERILTKAKSLLDAGGEIVLFDRSWQAVAGARDVASLVKVQQDWSVKAAADYAEVRADGGIGVVGNAGGNPGTALHDDLVALAGQFARAGRGEADAVLVVLDFLGDADKHGAALPGRSVLGFFRPVRRWRVW